MQNKTENVAYGGAWRLVSVREKPVSILARLRDRVRQEWLKIPDALADSESS